MIEEHRIETKASLQGLASQNALSILKWNQGSFKETYEPRWINNLYLDSLDWTCFFNHIDGEAERRKYRIRWYGPLKPSTDLLENPFLEVKTKRGLVMFKERYPLPEATLEEAIQPKGLQDWLARSSVPLELKTKIRSFSLTLFNRYQRRYFSSHPLRTTLDTQLEYQRPERLGSLSRTVREESKTILEFKYPPAIRDEAARVISALPFPMSKNSKYVQGLLRIHA